MLTWNPAKPATFMTTRMALLAGAILVPAAALAHPGHGETSVSGGLSGLLHPLAGFDHLLAMMAIGLWAVQLGGRAVLLVPAAFLGVMVVGAALGLGRVPLPGVEAGVAASVLALGLAIACAWRMPTWTAAGLAGVFALFHGHSHGAEWSPGASAIPYAVGFVFTTAALHAAGAGFGLAVVRLLSAQSIRWAGGALVLGGAWLLAAS